MLHVSLDENLHFCGQDPLLRLPRRWRICSSRGGCTRFGMEEILFDVLVEFACIAFRLWWQECGERQFGSFLLAAPSIVAFNWANVDDISERYFIFLSKAKVPLFGSEHYFVHADVFRFHSLHLRRLTWSLYQEIASNSLLSHLWLNIGVILCRT